MPPEIKIIAPEDFVIEHFLKAIEYKFQPKVEIWNAVDGISSLARILIKFKSRGEVIVGFLDNDKVQNPAEFYDEFVIVEQSENLLFKRHKDCQNIFLIYFNPEFEPFLLEIGNNGNQVVLNEFNIPTSFDELCKLTKGEKVLKNEDLKRLFKYLVRIENSTIKRIITWVDQIQIA